MDASRPEGSFEDGDSGDGSRVAAPAVPVTAPPAPSDERAGGLGVALLLAAAAVVAAIVTARASVLGGQATDLWQQAVREEQRRGAVLIQGVRFTYGDVGDLAFLIATSQVRSDALREASASAAPDIAARLAAESRVHAQVAEAMRASVSIANDPELILPSGGYDLEASLARDRQDSGDDDLPDPAVTVAAADRASAHAIRIVSVTIVVALAFLAGSLAQAVRSRRRAFLVAGWVTLGASAVLAAWIEVTA